MQALVNTSLYEGQLNVNNSSVLVREQAMPQILQQVLVKVSGNQNIITIENLKEKVSNFNSLIESYGYTENNDGTTNQLILTIRFDQVKINQILRVLANDSQQLVPDNNQIIIIIKGIKNFSDYNMVTQYFSSISPITDSEIIAIENNYVKLKITAKIKLLELVDVIKADNKLTIVTFNNQYPNINLICSL